MRYKEMPPKHNLILMCFIISAVLLICIAFLLLKKYYYFGFYFFITIILTYFYLFTYYYIENDYLLIQIGFLKTKIKYMDIIRVEENKRSLKIFMTKFKFTLYPNKKNRFVQEFRNKLNSKVKYIVLESEE